MHAAYREAKAEIGTSIVAVYNKLNGLETHTSAELVRYSARVFTPLIAQVGGEACALAARLSDQDCRWQLY